MMLPVTKKWSGPHFRYFRLCDLKLLVTNGTEVASR